jgi:hypothetical protein
MYRTSIGSFSVEGYVRVLLTWSPKASGFDRLRLCTSEVSLCKLRDIEAQTKVCKDLQNPFDGVCSITGHESRTRVVPCAFFFSVLKQFALEAGRCCRVGESELSTHVNDGIWRQEGDGLQWPRHVK